MAFIMFNHSSARNHALPISLMRRFMLLGTKLIFNITEERNKKINFLPVYISFKFTKLLKEKSSFLRHFFHPAK
jgi:hypothetical protein